VLKEVPPNSTVVGIPGEIVKGNKHKYDEIDQIDLPNPVMGEINALKEKLIKIEHNIDENIEYRI
jgi:serine O-acetyltransferase